MKRGPSMTAKVQVRGKDGEGRERGKDREDGLVRVVTYRNREGRVILDEPEHPLHIES